MNIFIMGAPGSGKGTFSNKIKEEFNLMHISTGDIFRENIKHRTPLGKEAEAYIEQGHLVPDSITIPMVADYLKALPKDKNGYLLDGFPRTLSQAEAFEEMTAGTPQAVDSVIALDVPEEVLTKRITGRRICTNCHEIYNVYYSPSKNEGICDCCGSELSHRDDDNEESLKVRLQEYADNTQPVIDYYAKKNKVYTVDANHPVDEIWKSIENTLLNPEK